MKTHVILLGPARAPASISAGSWCTTDPSSHSQPSTISSQAFRSRRANMANRSVPGSSSSSPSSFLPSLPSSPSPALPSSPFRLSLQRTGRRMALGRQPERANRVWSPAIRASSATGNGRGTRCTKGLGMPVRDVSALTINTPKTAQRTHLYAHNHSAGHPYRQPQG